MLLDYRKILEVKYAAKTIINSYRFWPSDIPKVGYLSFLKFVINFLIEFYNRHIFIGSQSLVAAD